MCLWEGKGARGWCGERTEREGKKKITILTRSPVCTFSLSDLNTQMTIAEGY